MGKTWTEDWVWTQVLGYSCWNLASTAALWAAVACKRRWGCQRGRMPFFGEFSSCSQGTDWCCESRLESKAAPYVLFWTYLLSICSHLPSATRHNFWTSHAPEPWVTLTSFFKKKKITQLRDSVIATAKENKVRGFPIRVCLSLIFVNMAKYPNQRT